MSSYGTHTTLPLSLHIPCSVAHRVVRVRVTDGAMRACGVRRGMPAMQAMRANRAIRYGTYAAFVSRG